MDSSFVLQALETLEPLRSQAAYDFSMKISELGRATGVDVETIRFYEKEGLLPPPAREANGYRSYGHEHLERLAFIRHCRALDIPLAEVQRLLDFVQGTPDGCGDIDALIDRQLERVRARLASLQALERQLDELRRRCDADHATHECGILQELVAAAHGEACVCHPHAPGA
jgi:Cd(II)/Pb(II)-responsive transcriptional regulator